MTELLQLIAGETFGPLDVAAAQVAGFEYPQFDASVVIARLDALGAELLRRCPLTATGREFVRMANRMFFEELGFHGNDTDYYDPRNSFLNDVLERRQGIPITLGVIYMEVARRAGRVVNGVGLPGHFVVQFADPGYPIFIDTFHDGRLLTRADCVALVRERAGSELQLDSPLFAPVTPREIVVRMLRNLKGNYLRGRHFEKALAIADVLGKAGLSDDSSLPPSWRQSVTEPRNPSSGQWN